jgi:hypothetical protein
LFEDDEDESGHRNKEKSLELKELKVEKGDGEKKSGTLTEKSAEKPAEKPSETPVAEEKKTETA